jgi:hypothetical protein
VDSCFLHFVHLLRLDIPTEFCSYRLMVFPFLKVGMITKGNVVRAALKMKKEAEEEAGTV